MIDNILTNSKRKKTIIKMSMTALVSAITIYAGTMFGASAMKRRTPPIQSNPKINTCDKKRIRFSKKQSKDVKVTAPPRVSSESEPVDVPNPVPNHLDCNQVPTSNLPENNHDLTDTTDPAPDHLTCDQYPVDVGSPIPDPLNYDQSPLDMEIPAPNPLDYDQDPLDMEIPAPNFLEDDLRLADIADLPPDTFNYDQGPIGMEIPAPNFFKDDIRLADIADLPLDTLNYDQGPVHSDYDPSLAYTAYPTRVLDKSTLQENGIYIYSEYIRFSIKCEVPFNEIFEILMSNPTFKKLIFENCIGTPGAQMVSDILRSNTSLQVLDLYGNIIGIDGARMLSDALITNTSLQMLDLFGNDIGDYGAKILAASLRINTTLKKLRLDGNEIGIEGIQAISEVLMTNTTLEELSTGRNNVGNEGAQIISEALKVNTTLTDLWLLRSNISAEGISYISEAIKTNTTLQKLDLHYNPIEDKEVRKLLNAWRQNKNSAIKYLGIDNEIAPHLKHAIVRECKKHDNPTALLFDISSFVTERQKKYLDQ